MMRRFIHGGLALGTTLALLLAGCEAIPPANRPERAAPVPIPSPAPSYPTVGGVAMLPTRTIMQNAAAAPNLATFVAGLRAAGLEQTLAGPGPFTVFAPTSDAFNRLGAGTMDKLMQAENKPSLVKMLTYHVVPGALTIADLEQRMQAGGGRATLTTVEGQPLVFAMEGQAYVLTDVNGNKSYLETPDIRQANGVMHVVNGVMVPKID